MSRLAEDIQDVTGQCVKVALVDSSYTGAKAVDAAKEQGIKLQAVKLPDTAKGFVLLPKRWIVERDFAWKTRFRRLVRDYERLPETVAGLHFTVFAILMFASLLAMNTASA